jgi:NADH dehydrogenase FAD-containing subunit
MQKQLLLLGGGHAHLLTLANLQNFTDNGYGVTVIQPSDFHYYSGMGPGMLGGTYHEDDIRFATRTIVEASGGRFVLGKASRIDPHKQRVYLENTEEEICYDVLSCNVGSYVPQEIVIGDADNVFTAKPIETLLAAKQSIVALSGQKASIIVVVGSGPSAIEIAGNINQLCSEMSVFMPQIKLFAGRSFMSGKIQKVRRLARNILQNKGIEIIEDGYVNRIENKKIFLENGEIYPADIIISAVGVKPSRIFVRSGLPTGQDGGLLVNEYLQSIQYDNIFGGGDCVHFAPCPIDKVGVYAVRQNPILFHNLMASLCGKALKKFSPGGKYLLIYNLGDGEGVLSKWGITFSGKWTFLVKDYIDRKFITTFQ